MRKLKQIGGKVEVIELELETVADLPHYRADRAFLDYIGRDINMSRSLIIQSGFDARLKIDLNIVESFVKKTFDYFNIEIKNISFSYGRTTKYLKYTQKNTEKFHQAYLGDNFRRVCFYSQNTSDFEPMTNRSFFEETIDSDSNAVVKYVYDDATLSATS